MIPAGLLALVLSAPCLSTAEESQRHAAAPVELVVLDTHTLARLELRVEVGGTPLAAIWDKTFADLFGFFDRDGSGTLDATEAERLPSPLALRHAMGNGFTPPIGSGPRLAVLDRNRDGSAGVDELASFYRAAGTGSLVIGVERLPASATLTAALVKALDTSGDGNADANEWKAAPELLRKLDTNDDELIGAGELVPKLVYPGAAGTLLLTPPSPEASTPDVLENLPLLLLPASPEDTRWCAEVVRRLPGFKTDEAAARRRQAPDAQWVIRFGNEKNEKDFVFTSEHIQIASWNASGKLNDAVSSARRVLTDRFETPPPPAPAKADLRRRGGDLSWLVPIADRNKSGKLDRAELDAWLDLQAQIARGQVLMTLLDGAGLFEVLDSSHDGALSTRELRTAWQRLKDAHCGTDDRGFDATRLPRGLLAVVSQGYPQTLAFDQRRGPAWSRAMDRNGDGDVSQREFTGPAAVFGKLDRDHDGLIDGEEAAHAAAGTSSGNNPAPCAS